MLSLGEQLTEAREAYHKLQTGAGLVSLTDSNGERVEYRPANAKQLAAYIADLERQVGGRSRPSTLYFQASKGV